MCGAGCVHACVAQSQRQRNRPRATASSPPPLPSPRPECHTQGNPRVSTRAVAALCGAPRPHCALTFSASFLLCHSLPPTALKPLAITSLSSQCLLLCSFAAHPSAAVAASVSAMSARTIALQLRTLAAEPESQALLLAESSCLSGLVSLLHADNDEDVLILSLQALSLLASAGPHTHGALVNQPGLVMALSHLTEKSQVVLKVCRHLQRSGRW